MDFCYRNTPGACLPPQPLHGNRSSSPRGDNGGNQTRSDKEAGGGELQGAATSHFKATDSFYRQVQLIFNKE